MKAVLLAPTPPPAGGIASWTVRMMNAKLKNNWQVSVVDEKLIGKRQIFGRSKRNLFFEVKRCLNIWKNLTNELNDNDVKVVHSCIPSVTLGMMREYVCACITKWKKRKFIIHFRCTVPTTTKGRIGNFVLKKLCNKSDLIITLNEQSNVFLKQLTETPLKLIPNFIESSELCDEHEIRTNIETVLYVGGVIKTKGAYDILKIAQRLPQIEFKLIGQCDDVIESYAKNNNITNVVFTGQQDKEYVKEQMKNSDVFLFMTYFRGEGFSNSLVEAMAMGLPCVVTDWAANADMISNAGGYVVKVGDVDSAVDSIIKMQDPNVRKSQSSANILRVKQNYIDVKVLDEYVNAYEQVIGE